MTHTQQSHVFGPNETDMKFAESHHRDRLVELLPRQHQHRPDILPVTNTTVCKRLTLLFHYTLGTIFSLSCTAAKTPCTQAAWLHAASFVIECVKSTCICSCDRRGNLQPSACLLLREEVQ